MNFVEAMTSAKEGKTVRRTSWLIGHAKVTFTNMLRWSSNDHPQQHYIPTEEDIFALDWTETA